MTKLGQCGRLMKLCQPAPHKSLRSAHALQVVASSHSVPGRGATRKLEAAEDKASAEDGASGARAKALSSTPSKVHSAVKAGASQIMDGWRAMRSAVLSSSARKLPGQAGSGNASSKSPSFSSKPSGPSGKALLPSPPVSSSTAAHNTSSQSYTESASKEKLTLGKPRASLTPSVPASKQRSSSKSSKAEPKASAKQKGRSGHSIVDAGDVDSDFGDRKDVGPDMRSLPPSNHSLIVKLRDDGKLDLHPFWGSRVERVGQLAVGMSRGISPEATALRRGVPCGCCCCDACSAFQSSSRTDCFCIRQLLRLAISAMFCSADTLLQYI